MNARRIGMAVALVLAMACRTSGTQSDGKTSSAGEPRDPQTSGTTASGTGHTAGEDPLMKPGPAVKGHASDQVVSGAITQVSPHSVSIASDRGSTVVLEIVPETSITKEGSDVSFSDLLEGQSVRASFNDVAGQEVAVEIQVLELPARDTVEPSGRPPSPGGTYGSGSSGSTGSGDTGTSPGTGPGAYPPGDVIR